MVPFELIVGALQLLTWLSPIIGMDVGDPTKLTMYDQEYQDTFLEMNIGKSYFEGDILLTQQQSDAISTIQHNSSLEARALVRDVRKLWPNKVVPYVLASDLRPETREYITSALAEWQDKTCLTFKKRESENDYIEYLYEGGCSSYVGRIGGRQTISVGSDEVTCKHGNIVHETAHALGFFHEHSRPDRDDYVEVKWGNVEPGYEKNFRKETIATVDSRDVGYDYASVMHYGAFFFTKTPGEETIHPKEEGAQIGQRIGLSELDTEQANKLYECDTVPYTDIRTHARDSKPDIWQQPSLDEGIAVLRHKVQPKVNKHKAAETKDSIKTTKHKATKKTDEIKGATHSSKPHSVLHKIVSSNKAKKMNAEQVVHKEKSANEPSTIQNDLKDNYLEMNIGKSYFEGDILLTKQQSDAITSLQSNNSFEARAIIKDVRNLWSNKVVPYVLADNLSPETLTHIKSAIAEWQEKTCIKFKEREDEDDYIEYIYDDKGGCSSYVGRVGGRQTIHVGSADFTCKHGNIVHETAHALGFFHEHTRPDRDDYVEVKWENIQPGYERNFNKETLETVDSKGVPYDYGSVMHYGAFFFTKTPGEETIHPKEDGAQIGQRIGLSNLDIQQANLLYECDEDADFKTRARHSKPEISQQPRLGEDGAVLGHKTHSKVHKNKKATTAHNKKHSILHKIYQSHKDEKVEVKQDIHKSYNEMLEKSADELSATENEINLKGMPATQTAAASRQALAYNRDLTDENLGEENFGRNYFEGDMILSQDQKSFLESLKNDDNAATKRALIKNTTFLWPDANVYYNFDEGVDEVGRERALKAMKHWEEHTCLRFKERSSEDDYIHFVFEGGCASRVGRGTGMQKLTIGSKALRCKVGNIIHEVGHAVGFFHEHSRPDRNKYVRIIKKNIVPGFERNFYRFSKKWIDSLNVSYDYGSIMHYARAFFSKAPLLLPTLVTLKKDAEIGQRIALSKFDVLQANLLYQCDGKTRLNPQSTDDEEQLYDNETQGPCEDAYDQDACTSVKDWGYCSRFPRTMRTTCGVTCSLCDFKAQTGQAKKKTDVHKGRHHVIKKLIKLP